MLENMVFVYYLSEGLDGKLSKAVGDRATVILDGRNNLSKIISDAHQFNGFRRPHYPGFQIYKRGEVIYATHEIED